MISGYPPKAPMNKKKACIVFLSMEGLVYLMKKKNWMTAEEADSECDE